jgi:hypothetical protein
MAGPGPQLSAYLSGRTPNASQLFVVFGGHNNFRVGELKRLTAELKQLERQL